MESGESKKGTGKKLFPKGVSGNPNGRPPMTPEQKALRKASREIIEEYKQSLIDALPMISPVLVAKALQGDIPAIKELHDRTMDKAKQSTEITGKDGKDLIPTEEINEKIDSAVKSYLHGIIANTP